MGKFLRVNLTREKIIKQNLDNQLKRKFVGGLGFTTKILFDEIKPGTDPLGPDNKLIIAVGPCNGTLVPGSARCTVAAKSPLSGFLGDSNAGGFFGSELKYAGYDIVVIEGIAKKLCYLIINDDEVSLVDAEHLRMKTTSETRRIIQQDFGDEVRILSIGPAGENLVKFACIISDFGRAHGRCGLGAVMGSKNIKAIVVKGSGGVKVADPNALEKAVQEMYEIYHEYNDWYSAFTTYGATRSLLEYNRLGILPTRNYQSGVFENIGNLDPKNLRSNYLTTMAACFSCPLGCNTYYTIDREPFLGSYGAGLELMQMEMFGPRIGIDNLNAVLKMHIVANELGLDAADLAGALGFAFECFEKRILTIDDFGGDLEPKWGNFETALKLIERIAYRDGIGNILAEGAKKASEIIGKGSEKYALCVKGLSLDTLDPRGMKGWGLGYAISSRGADHCRHLFASERIEMDPLTIKGKAEGIVWHENIRAFQNSMEICEFCTYYGKMVSPQMLIKFYSSVTGIKITEKELIEIGERIVNLARLFNVREGLTKKDDTLPQRFLTTPMPAGSAKGHVVELQPMIDRYYELRGWDRKTGLPTREKLVELGLEDTGIQSMGD
jgi:aldehyde:ferredoxin oxidoreductase